MYRQMLMIPRNIPRLFNLFYWPLMDIIIWGFSMVWIQSIKTESGMHVQLALLTCLTLWTMLHQANLELTYGMIEEVWDRNLFNLFCTPLTLCELIIGTMIMSIFKLMVLLVYCWICIKLIFGISVFSLGVKLIPLIFSVILSGWIIGLFATASLINWGKRLEMIFWSIAWFFIPFSAVFYPIKYLPSWAQAIGRGLPMSYIFEAIRSLASTGSYPFHLIIVSFTLNGLYLIISILFLMFMFYKSKQRGLARLE